jgi:hypothetical protein
MPTHIEKWTCDVCGDEYRTYVDAIKCEQRGTVKEHDAPAGLIFEIHSGGYGVLTGGRTEHPDKHVAQLRYWATDMLGRLNTDTPLTTHTMGPEEVRRLQCSDATVNSEAFRQICDVLRSMGITPQYNQAGRRIKLF